MLSGLFKGLRVAKCAGKINKTLDGLSAGKNAGKKVVGSSDELNSLFKSLSKGGKPIANSTYPGTLKKLPDGTTVGLRQTSKSGGPTIDIKLPDGTTKKVHVDQ